MFDLPENIYLDISFTNDKALTKRCHSTNAAKKLSP